MPMGKLKYVLSDKEEHNYIMFFLFEELLNYGDICLQ